MAEILTDNRRTYGALDGQPGDHAIRHREAETPTIEGIRGVHAQ
jgi:hypothetical protein